MRFLPFVILALSAASSAGAQIIRPRYGLAEPKAWASLGAGVQQGFSVTDGSTGTVWRFGNGTQYIASLEKAFSGGNTIGVKGAHSKVPLTFSGGALTTEADANVSQLMGVIHIAGNTGFHSVLELSAGATMYSNFRARDDGRKLAPASPDYDFSFAFGYGFGYSFSSTFSIDIVQDLTTSIHQKTGLSAGDDSTVRLHSTRVMGRFGLGL